MPYASRKDLPDPVKKMPDHHQDIFKAAFNSAYKEHGGDEKTAFAIAYGAVNKAKMKKALTLVLPLTKAADEPYGDVEYADPGYQADGKKRYPINTPEHAKAAWSYINHPDDAAKYSPEHLALVKGRIKMAYKKHFGNEPSK